MATSTSPAFSLETRAGRIHGRMRQSPLRLSPPLSTVGPLAEALGLPAADVLTHPAPLVANTGTGHLLVRVRDSLTVDRARPVSDRLLAEDKALVVEQGVHLGRRSLWHVRLTPEPEISGVGIVLLRGLRTLS